VIEGNARRVAGDARLQPVAEAWEAKYGGDWHFDVVNGAFHGEGGEALVFEVKPSKIIAF